MKKNWEINMNKTKVQVSKATIGRLPRYLQYLDLLDEDQNISATNISRALFLGEVQVRKDLSSVCDGGKPKVGYNVGVLRDTIKGILSTDEFSNAVIVGAGKLGLALTDFKGFTKYGVNICASFDNDKSKVGKTENNIPILIIDKFEDFCREHNITIAIITVPAEVAQKICDLCIKAGIKAIWNFAPVKLNYPDKIIVEQEDLALSLAHIRMRLKENNK